MLNFWKKTYGNSRKFYLLEEKNESNTEINDLGNWSTALLSSKKKEFKQILTVPMRKFTCICIQKKAFFQIRKS